MERKILSEGINAETFKRALIIGRGLLQEHVEEINRLNVFPVPDGDTGSNMFLTLDAVMQGLSRTGTSLQQIMDSVAQHALIGARGNSGVILAQFLIGFADTVSDREAVDANALAAGFASGTEEAYRIVSHPQEGTILTIMRTARDTIMRLRAEPLPEILARTCSDAREALAHTPEMHPILKLAGVIDAGGLGFVYLLSALAAALDEEPHPSTSLDDRPMHRPDNTLERIQQTGSLTHRYCTEFIVQGYDIPQSTLRDKLDHHADSVLVLGDTDHTHVHLHTDDPGQALRIAATYGRVLQVKVDDMYLQVQGILRGDDRVENVGRKTGLVAVSPGEGISEILRSIGASEVLTGNPAVGDLIAAGLRVEARGVIFLPNDPNILLACKQAGEFLKRPTLILPSESIPQGINALLSYDPQQELEENVEAMRAAIQHVRSGSVGRAVHASTLNGVNVAIGDYVGMLERHIATASSSIEEVILDLLELMDACVAEVITLFYGLDEQEEDATIISSYVRDRYPNVDVQVYYGGQDRHNYLISVE